MIKLKSLFRRGQGPSGSKHSSQSTNNIASANGAPLKGASSVSSLDCVGVTSVQKASNKNSRAPIHGSKDRLEQYSSNHHQYYSKGSKEKLTDFKSFGNIVKSSMSVAQHQFVQPQVAYQSLPPQQQLERSGANRDELDQRDDDAYSSANEDIVVSNELRSINVGSEICETNKMQELQAHLRKLNQENAALEEKIVEMSVHQRDVQALRDEIDKLQTSQEMSNNELHRLLNENETLRERLRTIVQSPLSDSEKHQIIKDSQRLHSSAPASIALPINMDMDGTPCVTPDWDKHSSSSEIAVACLQDKITQMEETHYSTNEELQATLQELADLQSQIIELQSDNERLAEEKDVIFQSLCRQTEKLEDSRTQIGTLQKLLLREPNQQDGVSTEREQKLVELLKNAQDERESLMLKQEELYSELNELKVALEDTNNEKMRLHGRIGVLESTIDATNAERTEIDTQLLQSKEDSSVKQIEISRLTTLLENARAKIDELEQDRALGDKSDLGELLDVARKEKDALEIQVASLQEQVSISQCEIQKLKDQLARMSEECKVVRNNAKCVISDLEYKHETIKQEKNKIVSDCQQLQENVSELQVQNKCLIEDKGQLEALLSEAQKHLGETERLLAEKTDDLNQEISLRKQESEEWERFQSDLLMTVRVANDFKTEAHNAREQLALDNKALRERIRLMEQQIEKLNKPSDYCRTNSKVALIHEDLQELRQGLFSSIDNLNVYDRNADEFYNQVDLLRKQLNSISFTNRSAKQCKLNVDSNNVQRTKTVEHKCPLSVTKAHDRSHNINLSASDRSKMSVRFASNEENVEHFDTRLRNSDRSSYEVESINALQRHISGKDTPLPHSPGIQTMNNCSKIPAFRPIAIARSNDCTSADHSFKVVKPIPLFTSKSISDLRECHKEQRNNFVSLFPVKSSDDLIVPDIDGITKASNLSRFKKYRSNRLSTSTSLNDLDHKENEKVLYENVSFEKRYKKYGDLSIFDYERTDAKTQKSVVQV